MSASAWEKVRATWRDLTFLSPSMHMIRDLDEQPIYGYSIFRYGRLIATWGVIEFDGKHVLQLCGRPEMREYEFRMIREGLRFMEEVDSTVYAYEELGIDGAGEFLCYLGFVETGEILNGMKEYRYG